MVPAVYDAALRTAGSEILAAVEDARADWQHLRDQLVHGLLQAGHRGRLVLPLDLRGPQRSIAFQPIDNHLESVSVVFCGFMRMRGAFAGPESIHQLGPEPGVFLGTADQRRVDVDALYAALAQPGVDVPSGVRVTLNDPLHGLGPMAGAPRTRPSRAAYGSRSGRVSIHQMKTE